jgi:anion-transporting  ArsA/GET3 family ATPase
MIELLKSHKVLICAGTGGVGKTSLSASLGVLAARSGIRTLVLTIDPAKRLAQSLGIDAKPGEEVSVPGIVNLSAAMIEPRREFDQFVLGTVDKGIAKGLFNNRLYQQLVSNLNGSQEFTSLVRLMNAAESDKFDLVILDTPPTQNAVDFLKAPERIYALFQDSVIGWFSSTGEEKGFIRRNLHRGTRLVTAALERVTGSIFIHELKDFFAHIYHLQARVSKMSADVNRLLHSKQTGFLLVTGFDETKLKEALEFQQDLAEEKLKLRGVVVNRWFPEWGSLESRWPAAWDDDADFKKLKEFYGEFSEFFKHRQEIFERFTGQLGSGVPVIKLPDFKNTVQGLEDLTQMANTIEEKWRNGR